jgi:hypothetical protein
MRAAPPVESRHLLPVLGVVRFARGGVRFRRLGRLRDRPKVFLAREATAAGVLEDRDAREVDRSRAARMVAPVLDVDADAARLRVDHVPLVGAVDLAVLRHDRLDPGADRLAAVHRAEHVLDVRDVLGEALDPGIPVLRDRPAGPVVTEGRFDLVAREAWHAAPVARRLRPLL